MISGLVYMAHPVAGDVPKNIVRGREWLRWCLETFDAAVIAPWIVECELFDEATNRDKGLSRCVRVVAKCDALLLCGPKISEGMEMEVDAALTAGLTVWDITGPEHPPSSSAIQYRRICPWHAES